MTAQELRTGNKVFYKTVDLNTGNEILNEITITANDIKIIELNEGYNRYFPIPLTEEWMLKLGFEKVNGGLFKRHTDSETTLDWDCLTGLYLMGDDGKEIKEFDHIEYVHQLQNLYHALTSEELTIKEEGK